MDYDTLVLSGGGIKGLALIGALQLLDFSKIHTFAGSSIGALICFMLSIGYKPDYLRELNTKINWGNFQKINWDNIIDKWSISDFTEIRQLILTEIHNKGLASNITFEQLHKLFNKKLIITGTNISKKCVEYFSYESTPNMPVIIALNISMNYPFIFPPVRYNNSLYIDGAVLAPFPMKVVKNNKKIGVFLGEDIMSETASSNRKDPESIFEYATGIIDMMYNRYCSQELIEYRKDTCIIHIKEVHSMDFTLDENLQNELYNIGYQTMKQYLETRYK